MVVVVAVDDVFVAFVAGVDWLVSSCTSFASSELRVDWAEETDSLERRRVERPQ